MVFAPPGTPSSQASTQVTSSTASKFELLSEQKKPCTFLLCAMNPTPFPPPSRRSARLAGDQPNNLCIPNYTKPGVDVVWKAACEKDPFEFKEVSPQSLERNSPEAPRPVQPHSVLAGGPHPISSSELGVGFQASNYPYRHGTRVPNSKDDFERTKNVRLNFPAPTIRKDGLNSTQSYRMCCPGGSAQHGFAPPLLRVWPLTLMISFTSSSKSSVA